MRGNAKKALMATWFLLVCPAAQAGEIQDLYHASGNVVEQQGERRFGDATAHGITEIGIERTVCFGACPIYTFIVKSDGTFRYSGEDFVARKGTSTGTVPIHDFNLLAQYIRDSGYMELADRYTIAITDNPTVYTTVVMDGKRKIVSNYANAGPKELWAIEELIDGLLAKATWN